jgi:hypothetical protein
MEIEEVTRFLHQVNYLEIMPLQNGDKQYKRVIGHCRKKGLVFITPDNNCIISVSGLKLLNGTRDREMFRPWRYRWFGSKKPISQFALLPWSKTWLS